MPESNRHSLVNQDALIDWADVRQHYNGRQAFIDKLIRITLDGTQQDKIQRLRLAAEQQDYANIEFIAHSLKGIADAFKAQNFQQQAHQTELAAENRQDTSSALANELAITLGKFLEELQNYQRAPLV